jgi:hypothetical protein
VLDDPLRIDAQIAVHEDGAEAPEPFQLLPERGLDDAVRAELGDDVLVVRGADPKVRAQNMVADIEEDLGAELDPRSMAQASRKLRPSVRMSTVRSSSSLEITSSSLRRR